MTDTVPDGTDPQAVLAIVRVAWGTALPWAAADDAESWDEAGGDSLDAMKLLAQLELMLGRPLSHELLDGEMTPPILADRIVNSADLGDDIGE